MSQQFPTTEEEWRTHVLNIHGTPFEQICEHHLRQAPDWAFRSSRYPVEFPPSYTPQASLTKNSELDLWGICRPSGLTIELLVECKKNNPEYTDWVFFPARHPTLPSLRTLGYRSSQEVGGHWAPYRETVYLVTPPDFAITDDGRETKGNYQAKWQQIQKENQKQQRKEALVGARPPSLPDHPLPLDRSNFTSSGRQRGNRLQLEQRTASFPSSGAGGLSNMAILKACTIVARVLSRSSLVNLTWT